MPDMMSKGSPSKQFSDEQAKGFSQGGIPKKKYDEFHEGGATATTPPERATNVQKEDKGS